MRLPKLKAKETAELRRLINELAQESLARDRDAANRKVRSLVEGESRREPEVVETPNRE